MKKNIVVVTYSISPYKGSESSVSWNYVKELSKSNTLYVFYSSMPWGYANYDISEWLKTNDLPNVYFFDCFRDCPRTKRAIKIKKLSDLIGSSMLNKIWLNDVQEELKKFLKINQIDIIHFLNPIGFRTLSFDWETPYGIPIVYGPVQGVEPTPWSMVKRNISLPGGGKFFTNYLIRRIFLLLLFKYSGKTRKLFRKSTILIAATPISKKQIKIYHHRETLLLPENGIMSLENCTPITFDKNEPLRLIWIGTLDCRKNLILLLESLARLKSNQWRLDVVGDGQLKEFLKRKARDLKLSNIIWHGLVHRDAVFELLQKAHLHIITSCREGNPTTIWEAMSKGVPTLSLAHCGMDVVLSDADSIKIPIASHRKMVEEIAKKIDMILEEPFQISQLSNGTVRAAHRFSYNRRVVFFNKLFDGLLHK